MVQAKQEARAGIALTHASPPLVVWQFLRLAMMEVSALTAEAIQVHWSVVNCENSEFSFPLEGPPFGAAVARTIMQTRKTIEEFIFIDINLKKEFNQYCKLME